MIDYNQNDVKKIFKLRGKYQKTNSSIYKLFIIRKCRKLEKKNNSFFPLESKIGDNAIFPHGLNGIFISTNAIIGNNCVIFHQVTIGSNNLKNHKKKGSPIIGDNVYIVAGAKIIGNVVIGNNCRIGANAVVTSDIPPNSTVVLEKCRIIKKYNKVNNAFFENISLKK